MNSPPQPSDESTRRAEMERLADSKRLSLAAEFLHFLRVHKKWWLIPLLLMLAVYGLFVVVSLSAGPAFMYTLF